ncbi:MAG: hypothetical protein NXH75_04065 [Halobacteriovoraceae bacterium]|nr:hypothetical protein [Halobacteriovoraceae bacterium]
MKKMMMAFAMASFVTSTFAFNFTGEFELKKQIYFHNYIQSHDCTADGGTWESEPTDPTLGFCFFDSADTVKVDKSENGYAVRVETIGTNAHSCYFEGEAKKVSHNQIHASAEAEYYDSDSDSLKLGICTVKVVYQTANKVDVMAEGPCQYFCGAKAWLEFVGAQRK